MFVKDVVLLACRELGLDEVADEIKNEGISKTQNVAVQSAGASSGAEGVLNQNTISNNTQNNLTQTSTQEAGALGETQNVAVQSAGSSVSSQSVVVPIVYSDGTKKEIEKLLECINLAVETITSSETPIVLEERVATDAEGKVSLDLFNRCVYEVLDAELEGSHSSSDFMLMPFHLYLPQKNSNYIIRYRAGSEPVNKLDEQIEVAPYIGVGVMVRAVVYEYLLSKNCYTEATFWKESYEDALEKAKIKNRKYRFKSRGIV